MINHEVHAIELEIASTSLTKPIIPIGIEEHEPRPENISGDFLHFLKDLFLEVIFLMWNSVIQIALESRVSQFISFLIFTIILTVLLYRIVCQMDVLIVQFLQIKLLRWCSDVTFPVPVAFYESIHLSDQQIMPNVELSTVVQEGLQVFLNDVGF